MLAFEDLEEFRVSVVKGANPGSKIPFKPGVRSIGVGRAVDNDIVISDPTVSRHHARIDIRADGCWLADAGSSTGVEKMGFKVGANAEPLASGDEFKIGNTILRFEIVAKKGAQKRAVEREAAAKAQKSPGAKPAPAGGLLGKVGLGSRRSQLLLVAVLVVAAAILLWPEAEQLPPQASGRLSVNYDAVFGYLPRDRSHLDKAVFAVPAQLDGLAIDFTVMAPSGVEIRVGDRAVATLPKDGKQQSYELLLLPKAFGQDATLLLTFDNLGYAPSDGSVDPKSVKSWGLGSMWMVRLPTAASSPAQLSDDLAAQRTISDRLQYDLSNRYNLLSSLRVSAFGLMKTSGKSFLLIPLPETTVPSQQQKLGELIDAARADVDAGQAAKALVAVTKAMQSLAQDLERDLRMQLNAATLAGKQGAAAEQGRALAIAAKTFPEPTDPRYRIIQSRVQRLGGGALAAYNATLEELGRLR